MDLDSGHEERNNFNSYYKCINNNNNDLHKSRGHISVTPQMIRTAVERLEVRKVYVTSQLIGQYICHHYPVNNDLKIFTEELKKKIDCAVHIGLIIKHEEDAYCLPTLREEANMLETMFTAFWEMCQHVINNFVN